MSWLVTVTPLSRQARSSCHIWRSFLMQLPFSSSSYHHHPFCQHRLNQSPAILRIDAVWDLLPGSLPDLAAETVRERYWWSLTLVYLDLDCFILGFRNYTLLDIRSFQLLFVYSPRIGCLSVQSVQLSLWAILVARSGDCSSVQQILWEYF